MNSEFENIIHMKGVYFGLLISIVSFQTLGQITIDNTTYSTTNLVDGVLVPVGSGTAVSNVTYQGVYNNSGKYQVGYFSTAGNTLTELGFAEGVVLSTGNTSDIPLTLGTNPGSVGQMSTGYFSSVSRDGIVLISTATSCGATRLP